MGNVSILIQPEGWMLQRIKYLNRVLKLVSILIQPEGWMLRMGVCYQSMLLAGVSILIQPEGWMLLYLCGSARWTIPCFNPHPARRLDATTYSVNKIILCAIVSILIQPEGWMLPYSLSVLCADVNRCFNPHPARRLDATRPSSTLMAALPCFNPHPARRLDATQWLQCHRWTQGFQSSSSPKAGCYIVCLTQFFPRKVSILIQPEGWMLR